MSFSFDCPFCKQKIETEEKYEGLNVTCPACGKTITMAKTDDTKSLPITPIFTKSPEEDSIDDKSQATKNNCDTSTPPPKSSIEENTEIKKQMAMLLASFLAIIKLLKNKLDIFATKVGNFINIKFKKNFIPKITGYILIFSCIILIWIVTKECGSKSNSVHYQAIESMKQVEEDFQRHQEEIEEIAKRNNEENEKRNKEVERMLNERKLKEENINLNRQLVQDTKKNNYEKIHDIFSNKTFTPDPVYIYNAIKSCPTNIDLRILKDLLKNISTEDAKKYTTSNNGFGGALYVFISDHKNTGNGAAAKLLVAHGGFDIPKEYINTLSLDNAFAYVETKNGKEYVLDNDLLEIILNIDSSLPIQREGMLSLLKKGDIQLFKKLLPNCYEDYSHNTKWNKSIKFTKEVSEINTDALIYIIEKGALCSISFLSELYKNDKKTFDILITKDLHNLERNSDNFYDLADMFIKKDDAMSLLLLLNNKKINIDKLRLEHFDEAPHCIHIALDYCKKNKIELPAQKASSLLNRISEK